MRWPLSLIFIALLASEVRAQRSLATQTDLLEIIVKTFNISVEEKQPSEKRISFSVAPVSTKRAGGRKIFVSSINAAFIIGNPDSTNVSSTYLDPFSDFSQNYGIGLKANIWTNKNHWNLPGEFRISSLTQYTYGLGDRSTDNDVVTIHYDYVRIYGVANRIIAKYLLVGPGLDYDRYYNVAQQSPVVGTGAFHDYAVGTSATSFSTGITWNMVYDNRKNSINPDKGLYANLSFRTNPSFLENSYQWRSVYADARTYLPLHPTKRRILALWGMYWGTFGDVPYLNLPGTSLEFLQRSGRGYSAARFRGKQMLYVESEYRFDITANGLFGGVIFANAQSYTDPITNAFDGIVPAVGFGGRIKFNKESNTNITLDLGFGKDSFSFGIGLGEYF
jgi:outer membrane protein assembly factor BamA